MEPKKEVLSYVQWHKNRDDMAAAEKYPKFDCHGMTYLEVEDKFENWLLLNSSDLPLQIITGNSEEMRAIVVKYLEKHKFTMYEVPAFNSGALIVLQ
jgi:cytochrome c